MIDYDSDLFYDIYNIISEHNRTQKHILSLNRNDFNIYI